MFWVSFIAGMFLGANIGLVVACMIMATKKRNVNRNSHPLDSSFEYALMEELRALQSNRASNTKSQSHPIGS